MIVDDPSVPGICRYSAFRRPEPEPEETPVETEEPMLPPPEPTQMPAEPPTEPTPTEGTGTGTGTGVVVPGGETTDTPIAIASPIVTDEDELVEPSPTDDPICFPADGSVQLEDGSVKRMDQLEVGDSVLVGHQQFSEVFMFSHRLSDVTNKFVKMELENGRSVEATVGHYMYVNGRLAVEREGGRHDGAGQRRGCGRVEGVDGEEHRAVQPADAAGRHCGERREGEHVHAERGDLHGVGADGAAEAGVRAVRLERQLPGRRARQRGQAAAQRRGGVVVAFACE
ncbi:hypothetical protein FGB62_40g164 [Gracilaria domingensis]|nr:hypothetical protein FGB62_40g164 [Gracilaria domingensis]